SFFCSSRRRHTRSIRDWSSDVCSADLYTEAPGPDEEARATWPDRSVISQELFAEAQTMAGWLDAPRVVVDDDAHGDLISELQSQIGRASCRERVSDSVGARALTKQRRT